MKEFISQIKAGKGLSRADARQVMLRIISGEVELTLTGEFLTALKAKGESVDEVVGFVQAMRQKMVSVKGGQDAVDLCGTGGDRKGTFNISTTASFVVAAAGLAVAKHGNRSVSSKCGSADILEKLGVKINLTPAEAEKCLSEIGYTFMLAPNFHPAMKNVAPVRKALASTIGATVFNILGPLCNPAAVKRQLIGIYDPSKRQLIASVLKELGHKCALVVHSRDGLDEISPAQPTECILLSDNTISGMEINPTIFGITGDNIDSLLVNDAGESSRIVESVLKCEKSVARDAVLLNAAAALYIGAKAATIKDGFDMAVETIYSGRALRKLEEFVKLSNSL